MSISLKNIDDRVRALEGRQVRFDLLTREPVFLNRTWKNVCNCNGYDFIYLLHDYGYSNGNIYTPSGPNLEFCGLLPLKAISEWPKYPNKFTFGKYESDEYSMFEITNGVLKGWSTQVLGGRPNNPNDNKVMVWGLKL